MFFPVRLYFQLIKFSEFILFCNVLLSVLISKLKKFFSERKGSFLLTQGSQEYFPLHLVPIDQNKGGCSSIHFYYSVKPLIKRNVHSKWSPCFTLSGGFQWIKVNYFVFTHVTRGWFNSCLTRTIPFS